MPAQTGGKRVQVAKRPSPAPRGKGTPAASPSDAASGLKVRAIWEELKKVVWPGFDDLTRMTGVVIATVLIFAGIIGGVDYVLAAGVSRIYNTPASTTGTATNNTTAATPKP